MTWLAWIGIALGSASLLLISGIAYAWRYAARDTSLADYRAAIARRRNR